MNMKIRAAILTFALILTLVFPLFLCPAEAAFDHDSSYHPPRVVDRANLLSDSEEKALTEKLNEISERQEFDVVIVTVYTTGGRTAEEFAVDYYDYNGYGYGDDKDGALLLVNMGEREWYISTTGYGEAAMNDAGLKYMEEQFRPMLTDGDYAGAFDTFAKLCDDFVRQARTGEPYTRFTLPHEALSLIWIPLSLLVGLIVALISVSSMKSKLKTVRRQAAANSYIRDGSMNLTVARDTFLYRSVVRRPKPKNNGGSGGGSHRGSSGTSHGGRGGRF